MRILVVEDEPDIRDLLQLILESELGATIDVAPHGEKALEVLEACLPDLLLTDIRMPRMDGLTLLERVKERWPDLPCVVVSAYIDPPLMKRATEELGARDVIRKPFDEDDLIARVRRVLETSA